MTHPQVDIRFTDALGRQQVMRATMNAPDGWLVQTSVEGQLFTRHCGDWQGVERTLLWLRRHVHDQIAPARARHSRAIAAAMGACMPRAPTRDRATSSPMPFRWI